MSEEAPVPPLAAQIEKVRRQIRYAQEDRAERAERLWSAVLATLQQHERLSEANKRMADDLSEWHEISGMVQEALGAAHNDPATWIPPMNFDTAIRKIRQQHERAMAVVEALIESRRLAAKARQYNAPSSDVAALLLAEETLNDALAALDDAASAAATPAGKGETPS